VRGKCKYCGRELTVLASGQLQQHNTTAYIKNEGRLGQKVECFGSGMQYVDLSRIPEKQLTIEQRARLRDIKRGY
jgi:hypothetical protein